LKLVGRRKPADAAFQDTYCNSNIPNPICYCSRIASLGGTSRFCNSNLFSQKHSAVKEAEAAGANITVITSALNEAGSLLSQAELAYAANDFDAALNLAIQSQNRLSNFIGEANTLREIAVQQQNQDFLINVVGSIVGTFVVIIAGFAVWRFLKKKSETTEAHTSESTRV